MTNSTLPEKMRAFILTGHGEMDKLVYKEDWPVPNPTDHEVLIQVGACGLNNTDVNTRTAWYSKTNEDRTTGEALTFDDEDAGWGGSAIRFPRIQGADTVGRVVGIGKNVPSQLMNKRVMVEGWLRDWDDPDSKDNVGYFGSECDGGFAEYTAVDYRNARPIETMYTDVELATFPCSWLTAEGMLDRAQVKNDDTVLITGASGGVGSALIGLAKRRGARTIAITSRTKHDDIAALQPDLILHREDNILNHLVDEKITVAADVVAGAVFPDLIKALERGGRYVTSGAIAGPIAELDIRTLYLHDLTLLGSTVVPSETFGNLLSYIESGEITPVVAQTYPLAQLKEAQQAFIDKTHTGNIVIDMLL